jgi:hypothetical protein
VNGKPFLIYFQDKVIVFTNELVCVPPLKYVLFSFHLYKYKTLYIKIQSIKTNLFDLHALYLHTINKYYGISQ